MANGCDNSMFASTDEAPLPTDVDLPRPIAGFIGHLSDRIDLALLEAVAATGRSLLLVGPRQPTFEMGRMERLLALPNVRWVGPKPFEALPSYMRVIDVGLTPYAGSEFNQASFPLKTLEYLAAGRSVVSSPLPAVEQLGIGWVRSADGPEAFADAVRDSLAGSEDTDAQDQRRAFAARHDWSVRALAFLQHVGLAPDGG